MMMMMRNDDHERVRKMSPGGGVGRGSGAGLPGAADYWGGGSQIARTEIARSRGIFGLTYLAR